MNLSVGMHSNLKTLELKERFILINIMLNFWQISIFWDDRKKNRKFMMFIKNDDEYLPLFFRVFWETNQPLNMLTFTSQNSILFERLALRLHQLIQF